MTDSPLFDTEPHGPPVAISLTQPWAMLAVLGEKQYETRHGRWRKSHPREVHVHASGGFPKAVRDFCRAHDLPATLKELCKVEPFRSALGRHGWDEGEHLPTGVILGKVRVVRSCRVEEVRDSLSAQERAFGNYSNGRTAIELTDPVMFKAWQRCRGLLGLWKIPEAVAQAMPST